ncbi:MAG: YigZ family protein [Bacteroidaceae bacterium]|nr:YigZ family protein [Bacteroidaceae bacterium]
MVQVDSYLTVKGEVQAQFVEQRSRFISFIWHVTTADEVKERIAALQKEYYDARHICYAYILGAERTDWRANDNGEPSGTAGKPILGQINSAGLTDVLIAVVRYFGGVKLGTSGLTEAYRLGATQVIEKAEVVTAYVERDVTVLFTYNMMNVVMKAAKDLDVQMGTQDWGAFNHEQSQRTFDCKMVLRARLSVADELETKLQAIARTQHDPELLIVKNKQ